MVRDGGHDKDSAVFPEDGHRKNAEKYLNEFFDLISKPDKVKRTYVTDCKPVGGM